MPEFVYKGIPIYEDGNVVAVQNIRGIEAANGKILHGIKDSDNRGNEFVYNRVPDNYKQERRQFVTADNQEFATVDNEMFLVR